MSIAEYFRPQKAEDDIRFKIAEAQMLADDAEFTDFPSHVRADVRRFHAFIELHKAQYDSSEQNRVWLMFVAGFLVVTQADKVIAFVEKFFV